MCRVDLLRAELAPSGAGGGAGVGRAPAFLRVETTTRAVTTPTTDGTGAFSCGEVPVGTYRVVARTPQTLAVTWDSEGAPGAAAALEPAAGEHRQAHVGLAGGSTVEADVRPDSDPLSGDVVLRWAGLCATAAATEPSTEPSRTPAASGMSARGRGVYPHLVP